MQFCSALSYACLDFEKLLHHLEGVCISGSLPITNESLVGQHREVGQSPLENPDERGVTAAALRGAAEEAVARKKDIGGYHRRSDCPAPPAEKTNSAVVPSIPTGEEEEEAYHAVAEVKVSNESRNASKNSGESTCPPAKRTKTLSQ